MKDNKKQNFILIVDFGSQYTQLISKNIRKFGVYCKIYSYDELNINNICINFLKGIILSGSNQSANNINSPKIPNFLLCLDVPILGICYGMHIIVIQFGGTILNSIKREFGNTEVEVINDNIIINNIINKNYKNKKVFFNAWMSHSDHVISIPKNFNIIAKTKSCPYAIVASNCQKFFGIQFHPEVTHTKQGLIILKNFIFKICKCKIEYTSTSIINNIKFSIRDKIGNDQVILGLSGGIDSLITAILLHHVIKDNLICIFVNNGLLSFRETKEIIEMCKKKYSLNIILVSEEKRFFKALKGIINPEEKRKIIGKLFIKIFYEQYILSPKVKWLAQGTIYSDVIESLSKNNNYIKSHHNVGGLPKIMHMKLIEPLKNLFKDEVRKIGINLGIPYHIIYKHPFPGPGFAIRIIGEVNENRCNILRLADSIFIKELKKYNLYYSLSQAFSIYLPINSVGIVGDNRVYSGIIVLRAIKTVDFMTSCCANLPYKFLEKVSNKITNRINNISRVLYDISSKPPSTIEWE
ncbi:MAG: glutamine-hydrolyzing GMP synthase [Enterobacterales bacterium]